MVHNQEAHKQVAIEWFIQLRNEICQQFEALERQYGAPDSSFQRTDWVREGGGGGQISLM